MIRIKTEAEFSAHFAMHLQGKLYLWGQVYPKTGIPTQALPVQQVMQVRYESKLLDRNNDSMNGVTPQSCLRFTRSSAKPSILSVKSWNLSLHIPGTRLQDALLRHAQGRIFNKNRNIDYA
ncbi:hypothetical protein C8R21_10143 [Nitrosospira multiformis]|jgi:hypothetical protein|uniref:Uncharacterized protein n=1 Tax=Nitrosospira multiformis TaxID=1231 RepID=A0A2T5IHQ6_9PROT|nr:hypothetical protein C8R21_10143 [Nitrosospira multiformis]